MVFWEETTREENGETRVRVGGEGARGSDVGIRQGEGDVAIDGQRMVQGKRGIFLGLAREKLEVRAETIEDIASKIQGDMTSSQKPSQNNPRPA